MLYKVFSQIHYKNIPHIQWYMLCSLLIIFPFAQAEKCEDEFYSSNTAVSQLESIEPYELKKPPSAVSHTSRDISNSRRSRMSYQEARSFIQKQGIRTSTEFKKWSKSDQRPKTFPSNPHKVYKKQWTSWGDFLGTENISTKSREYMSFKDAKTFIQKQGIRTYPEFRKWSKSGKRPKKFPSNPYKVYKKQWTSWGDFFGTKNISTKSREYMSFKDAKTFIQKQGIRTSTEFQKWSASDQRPKKFPSTPHVTYKKSGEWTDWKDFLGTKGTRGTRSTRSTRSISNRNQRSFEETKTFIQTQGVQTRTKMSYQEARSFIQKQGFQNSREFRKWSKSGKRPKKFPSNPHTTYTEWTSWGDFLGTENISTKLIEHMSFEDAKTFIQTQGLQTSTEFQKWSKSDQRPKTFPSNPYVTYEDQWTSWNDFLGTKDTRGKRGTRGIRDTRDTRSTRGISNRNQRSFEETKPFIQTQGVQTRTKMSYQEARSFIQTQGLRTSTEFREWSASDQRPENFPSNPHVTYKKSGEWTGWNDFLGTKDTRGKRGTRDTRSTRSISNRNRMSYQETKSFIQTQGVQTRTKMSYQEARSFIQTQGIRTHTKFLKWSKSDQRPENFPPNPHTTYTEWTSWGDFLGNINLPIHMQYLAAKEYVQSLGIDNPKDFIEWLKSNDRPESFPPQPHLFYSEWTNVKDFLSVQENTEYIPYQEAQAFIAYLGITTPKDFFEMLKSEPDVFSENFPPNPQIVYKKSGEWTGWNDFLGDKSQSKTNAPIETQEPEEPSIDEIYLEESFDEIDL